MPSKASEFKSRARKLITLPSGLEVEIRKFNLLDFVGVGDLPFPVDGNPPAASSRTPEKDRRREVEEIERYSNRAIITGCVNPRFTDSEDDENENVVHVRDLDREDWQAVVTEIFEWSGVSQGVAADADRFRADEISGNNSDAGGKIPSATDGDPSDAA
jgi:hypothetical protein